MGPITRSSPKITLKDVSLWRILGVDIEGLKVVWPATPKDPPLSVNIDQLKSRLSIFPLLIGKKNISTVANLYGGSLDSHVALSKENRLSAFNGSLTKIDLAKMDFVESALGAPLKGLVNLMIDISSQAEFIKDGQGNVNLTIEKSIFGPGTLNLPPGGFVPSLSVPQIALGNINAKFSLDKGQVESKAITLNGGDLEAQAELSISLGRMPQLSRINGKGWFSLKKEFISSNETIKMLFDLLPELRRAAQGDGKVGFSLRGTLGRPQFKLENYVAAQAANKT